MNPLKDITAHMKLMQRLGYGGTSGLTRRTSGKQHKPTVKAKSSGRFGRQLARQRSIRRYIPGTIGLSAVSEAIIEDHGRHVRRRVRKMIARRTSKPMKRYYNA